MDYFAVINFRIFRISCINLWLDTLVIIGIFYIENNITICPPIALRTDLSRIKKELWEIPVFSPADGALILHTIT